MLDTKELGEEPTIIPSPLEGEGKGEGDHVCVYYYKTVNNYTITYNDINILQLKTPGI